MVHVTAIVNENERNKSQNKQAPLGGGGQPP